MSTVTYSGYVVVGLRTYDYGSFTGDDGSRVEAGTKFYVFLSDPKSLGKPLEMSVSENIYDVLVKSGFGTVVNVDGRPWAKGSKIHWTAADVVVVKPPAARAA